MPIAATLATIGAFIVTIGPVILGLAGKLFEHLPGILKTVFGIIWAVIPIGKPKGHSYG